MVRCHDLVLGREVAVKALTALDERARQRVRREVAALRLLRIPGVVEILDEDLDGARPYIAMALVDGRPFPGGPASTWAALESPTLRLLEAVARMHGSGVIHRDLKPENVLVDAQGWPTILDLGLAAGDAVDDGLTRTGAVLGTPRYAAPEQLAGGRLDARADLYAIGVMLFELLAGRPPHPTSSTASFFAHRINQPAPPLRDVAAEVPAHVAHAVDLLLMRDRAERPRSAADVLALLRGHAAETTGDGLPWLGSRAGIERVLTLLRAGRRVRVAGSGGSGKSRLFREVAAALGDSHRVVPRGERPFSSLRALLGEVTSTDFDAVREELRSRLGARLQAGLVLIVDPPDVADPWSRELLHDARIDGAIASTHPRAPGEVVRTPALTAEHLQWVIDGPERLFHVPADAAQLLIERTAGSPRRLLDELERWTAAGASSHQGGRLRIDVRGLHRARGLGLAAPVASSDALGLSATVSATGAGYDGGRAAHAASLPMSQKELLDWLGRAPASRNAAGLAGALGRPTWEVDAELRRLARLRRVHRHGEVWAAVGTTDEVLSESRLVEAHARAAAQLQPGEPGRLEHLVGAGDDDGAAKDALVAAARFEAAGRLADAATVLRHAMTLCRTTAPGHLGALASALLRTALQENTTVAIDLALYEAGRLSQRSSTMERRIALARACRTALLVVGPEALDALDVLGRDEDDVLELLRLTAAVKCARTAPEAARQRVMRAVDALAEHSVEPAVLAGAALLQAIAAYRAGDFARSRALNLRAADLAQPGSLRIRALNNAAAAALEIPRLTEALRIARKAQTEAASARQPALEGQAEWVVRTALYRMGRSLTVDWELIEAIEAVGRAELVGQVLVTEAPIAWRAGDDAACIALCDRVIRLWSELGRADATLLHRALRAVVAKDLTDDQAVELLDACQGHPMQNFAIQVAGLVAMSNPHAVRARPELVRAWMAKRRAHAAVRLDVLSPAEAVAAVARVMGGP